MEKKTKQLSNNYLTIIWAFVLVGFIGLQFSFDLGSDKKTKNEDTKTASFLISTNHTNTTSSPGADLKFLQNWYHQPIEAFDLLTKVQTRPGFVFHILLRIELIRRLQASISINAP